MWGEIRTNWEICKISSAALKFFDDKIFLWSLKKWSGSWQKKSMGLLENRIFFPTCFEVNNFGDQWTNKSGWFRTRLLSISERPTAKKKKNERLFQVRRRKESEVGQIWSEMISWFVQMGRRGENPLNFAFFLSLSKTVNTLWSATFQSTKYREELNHFTISVQRDGTRNCEPQFYKIQMIE